MVHLASELCGASWRVLAEVRRRAQRWPTIASRSKPVRGTQLCVAPYDAIVGVRRSAFSGIACGGLALPHRQTDDIVQETPHKDASFQCRRAKGSDIAYVFPQTRFSVVYSLEFDSAPGMSTYAPLQPGVTRVFFQVAPDMGRNKVMSSGIRETWKHMLLPMAVQFMTPVGAAGSSVSSSVTSGFPCCGDAGHRGLDGVGQLVSLV